MKLEKRDIQKDGSGYVKLIVQDEEDLWHAFNLILPGDVVTSKTSRKVTKETTSGESGPAQRMSFQLAVTIKKVEFEPSDDLIRLRGSVTSETDHVRKGSSHTLEITKFKKFSLWKHQWDDVSNERLKEATEERSKAQAAAIVMSEGLANICLITDAMTLTKATVSQAVAKKRKNSASSHEKSLEKFFNTVYTTMNRIVDLNIVKAVIIASPGFIRDEFWKYVQETALKTENKLLLESKSKFICVHSSSGHRHALNEVLRDKTVLAVLSDTKAAGEVAILNKFMLELNKNNHQAAFGRAHVMLAAESSAIGDLLLSDRLFRARNVQMRRAYIALVESVKEKGGNVHIFSTLHISGEQLDQLSGVAAILRFPMPQIDELEDDAETETNDEDDEEQDAADPVFVPQNIDVEDDEEDETEQ